MNIRDLLKNLQTKIKDEVSSIPQKAFNSLPPVQAYNAVKTMSTPQFRQQVQQIPQQISNFANQSIQNTPVNRFDRALPQIKSNIQGNLKALSDPNTSREWANGFSDNLGGNIAKGFFNNWVAPAAQIPYQAKQLMNKDNTGFDRGMAGLQLGGNILSTAFPGVEDVAWAGIQGVKNYNKSSLAGGNLKQNLTSFKKGATGEEFAGLGDAFLAGDSAARDLLNMAELPVALLMGANIKNGQNVGFDKGTVEKFKNALQDPETRTLVQDFANMVENAKNPNRMNPSITEDGVLKDLGNRMQLMADDLFGRKTGTLSNTQLKNLFDILYQQAGDASKFNLKKIQLGASTQNVREGIGAQAGVTDAVNPLIQEAKKYGSAEEFINGRYDASSLTTPESVKWATKMQEDIKGLERTNLLNSIPVGKDGKYTIDPKIVINKKLKEFNSKYGTTATFDDFIGGKIGDLRNDILVTNQRKRLTDIYNQSKGVTKGVGSMPVKKVDPFEVEMDARTQELTNAAKLPKTEKTFIDTSKQATDVGDIKSNIGENGGVIDSIKKSFADWVNTRKASQVEGILQGRSFADLKEKGMQGIFEFQSGDKTGRYADVKNYFDTKYGQMQEKDINFDYKEDYLTQIWDNSSEEISKVFGKSLTKNPSFTLESIIKNYQEGINAGLKPKYNNIPDLIQSYESATNKAIADHNFFRTLIKENMITTGSKAPRDWVTIDPDRFPRFSVKTDEGVYKGIYKAPPELAKMLNNYLGGAKFEWLAKAADWTSSVKNRVLSFGIPGTAINAHGFNILARNVMSSKNPIEGAITGIKYMINPMSAQRQLDATLSKAPEAVKYGLTLSANEFTNILQEPQGFKSKFGDVWNKLFERGLFDRMLPSLKLQKFTEVFEGYKKGGMNEYDAGKAAAKFTNDVFGGINIDELGKSRDFENMLRVTILAPDWLKTNLNLAGKIPQSFTTKILDPKMSAYRKFATTMLGSYITANIVNKLTSGHFMYQNDPGNSFNIEAGYTEDGQKRYIRPFGTAADFARLPSDVFTAIKGGDVSVIGRLVRNRLSIPLGVGVGMLTDTDYAGQPIGWKGKDKYGNEMPLKQRIAGVGGEVLTLAGMPAFMKQGIDYASGKTGAEQALLQGVELPFRYGGGAKSKTSQFIRGVAQRSDIKGKDLYDIIENTKGVTFSEKQKNTLNKGGIDTLPDILQEKEINRLNVEATEIKKKVKSGEITSQEGSVLLKEIKDKTPIAKPKSKADNSLVSEANASETYANLPKKYDTEDDSPKNLIDKIKVYGTGIFKDPKGTMAAIENEEPIRKIRGDAVVVERLKNLSSLDQGNKATEVDHVIPLALGGTNQESNLAIISKQDNRAKGVVDTYLAEELNAGRISRKVAQERDLNWRNEINSLPAPLKDKANNILASTPEVVIAPKVDTKVVDDISSREFDQIYNSETNKYTDVQVKIPEPVKLTGLAELDKLATSKYTSAIKTAKTNIGKLYIDGQLTAEEANKALLSLKSLSSGSGGKGKKSKKITIKFAKTKKVSPIKIKSPTLKSIKITPPSVKADKGDKQLKLAKIKIKKPKGISLKQLNLA